MDPFEHIRPEVISVILKHGQCGRLGPFLSLVHVGNCRYLPVLNIKKREKPPLILTWLDEPQFGVPKWPLYQTVYSRFTVPKNQVQICTDWRER